MSLRIFRVLIIIFSALSLALLSHAANATPSNQSKAERVIAFIHATVIPMDWERILADHTVIVSDGRIIALGPSAKVKVPAGALRVDATGRFLIPALCDMHVHMLGEAWNIMLAPEAQIASKDIPFEKLLFPYVANGVTTVQELFGTPEELELRKRINRGELLGPRFIVAKTIDGPKKAWPPPLTTWVASPREAEQAVREAKAAGYDAIKVYSFLDKESYDAIVATAKELKMDVIGHVPMAVSVEYILKAGQKMIAHSEEIAKHAGDNYTPERINYFAELMAKRGVWMTPTLVTTHSLIELFDNSNKIPDRPELRYFRYPMQLGVWSFMTEKIYGPIPAQGRNSIRNDFYKFQRPLTKAFQDKGGKLMAGSDTIIPGLVAGYALHRELKEMVAAGLTEFEALRTSTTRPYEYLGEIDNAGTITVGKRSDLVLVDENPLTDISGASKVSGVLMRGHWIGAQEIKKRMEEIAESYQPAPRSRHARQYNR